MEPSLNVGDVLLVHDGGGSLTRLLHLLLGSLLLPPLGLRNLLDGLCVHRGEFLRSLVEIRLVVHRRGAHELAFVFEEPLGEVLVVVASVLVVRVVDDSLLRVNGGKKSSALEAFESSERREFGKRVSGDGVRASATKSHHKFQTMPISFF